MFDKLIPLANRSKTGSVVIRFLGLRVRILPAAWMSVLCECCQVEAFAMGRSLVQRSTTERGV
jgi:hypothetical protein